MDSLLTTCLRDASTFSLQRPPQLQPSSLKEPMLVEAYPDGELWEGQTTLKVTPLYHDSWLFAVDVTRYHDSDSNFVHPTSQTVNGRNHQLIIVYHLSTMHHNAEFADLPTHLQRGEFGDLQGQSFW